MRGSPQLPTYKTRGKAGCGWSNNFRRFAIVISRGIALRIPRYICTYWYRRAFTVVRKSPGVYELNYSKGQDTASGPPSPDIGHDVRRLLEISRNREKAKRWDRIEEDEWGDAKGQVQLAVRRGLSRKRVPRASEEGEDPIYIFIPRGRSHRIDGKHRDVLSSATAGKNHDRYPRLFRDRGSPISFASGIKSEGRITEWINERTNRFPSLKLQMCWRYLKYTLREKKMVAITII